MVFRLGEEALACPVTSAPRHRWEGRDRLVFRVEFPSLRDGRRTVEVGVVAVRGGSGKLKVVELELPPQAPYEDLEDIVLCWWTVVDPERDLGRRCPPVVLVWGFEFPPVFVAACRRPAGGRWEPFGRQLEELLAGGEGTGVRGRSGNFPGALRWPGPAACPLASGCGFSAAAFCPARGRGWSLA